MNNLSINAGYYGKLPLRGDFIQRNLSTEFIQMWDGWLQSVLSTSRETLNETWLNHYLVSPVWRYFISDSQFNYYAGVMLPSVDKVGRYFPFTLCMPIDQEIDANQFVLNNSNWYDTTEQLALHALNESISMEQLNEATDLLNTKVALDNINPSYELPELRIPLNVNNKVTDALMQISSRLPIKQLQTKVNYWWTEGTDQIGGNFISINGFPDDNVFTAMLDGHWELCHLQEAVNQQLPSNII